MNYFDFRLSYFWTSKKRSCEGSQDPQVFLASVKTTVYMVLKEYQFSVLIVIFLNIVWKKKEYIQYGVLIYLLKS